MYTYFGKLFSGGVERYELVQEIVLGCFFTTNTALNLAHWVFAHSYLALSFRVELVLKGQSEHKYNRQLNAINVIVCLLNVALPAI